MAESCRCPFHGVDRCDATYPEASMTTRATHFLSREETMFLLILKLLVWTCNCFVVGGGLTETDDLHEDRHVSSVCPATNELQRLHEAAVFLSLI